MKIKRTMIMRSTLLVFGYLFLSLAGWAQIRIVNITPCGPGAFPATTCTIPATGAGNLIVVGYAPNYGSMPTVTGISDNGGNAYVQAPSARATNTTSSQSSDIWYARNIKGGTTNISITPSPAGSSAAAVIWEIANADTVAPLEQSTNLSNQAGSSTPTGAAVTTTAPASVVITMMVPWGSVTGIRSGNAFINDSLLYGVGWAHLNTTAPGTYAAQWNASTTSYISSTAAFRGTSSTSANACDLAQPYGLIDAVDVQAMINMTLGVSPCSANIVGANVCNVVAVQRVINASLPGGSCVTGTTPISHAVDLNWTASNSTGVSGYNVYRSTTSGSGYTKITASPITLLTYTDTSVQAGQTYFYVTKAVGSTGLESINSNEARATVPTP